MCDNILCKRNNVCCNTDGMSCMHIETSLRASDLLSPMIVIHGALYLLYFMLRG